MSDSAGEPRLLFPQLKPFYDFVAIPLMLVAGLLAASAVRAQAPDAADVAEGMRLFRQKGNCQACHGWAGDGRKMDDQMPDGANLRESVLDRATLVLIVKCG